MDPGEVKKGRSREISELAQHVAWRYVLPGSVKGAEVVQMTWVDRVASRKAQKGPVAVKSRLCAQEFAWDPRGDTFAGTPPWLA